MADGPAGALPVASGIVSAPRVADGAIPIPVAELFKVASEYERSGRLDDAARMLGHLLAASPEQPDALHLAGIVAFRQGRPEDALGLLRRSLVRGSSDGARLRNVAEVMRVLGLLDEAVGMGKRALSLSPDDPSVLTNLALIHLARRELDAAEACHRRALSFGNDNASAHFGLAEIHLLRGDFGPGWREYEWRYRLPGADTNLPPAPRRAWQGDAVPPGRLLVVADQGYGDVIQFGRYIPWVLERCPEPLFAGGREMHAVLRQLGARVLHDSWSTLPDYDVYVTLSGLPLLAETRVDTVPGSRPYLRADPARAARWRGRLDGLLPPDYRRIGLAWAGRPSHPNDRNRSIPFSALSRIAETQGIALVGLQKGAAQADVAGYFGPAPLIGLGGELLDWDDTMAVIEGLDAVVTVDSAIAHLAGAMGADVHLLLPHAAEWRWMLNRDDTPWYPGMRLHRQQSAGKWDAPIASAARAIAWSSASGRIGN